MRPVILILIVLATVAGCIGLVFALDLDDAFARMVLSLQRDFQNALGRNLRALRSGQPGAVTACLGICFAYGFFHALGPGHGKAVIAAYSFASDSAVRRMIGIAAVSSLGQATVAVVFVYTVVWIWQGARERVEGIAAEVEPFSMLAIAAVGLLLAVRGIRRLRIQAAQNPASNGFSDHEHDPHCGCGHAHAPDLEEVSRLASWREAGALALGIALRPCTGALFLLLLTWRLGIDFLGVVGAYVMGVGTFMITALAAILTIALRRGLDLSVPGLSSAGKGVALIEIAFGSLILVIGISTAARLF